MGTLDKNEALQTDVLSKVGCERLFIDHASGAKAHRPELDHMLDVIREGDTLVVWKLDRLCCSLLEWLFDYRLIVANGRNSAKQTVTVFEMVSGLDTLDCP